MKVKITKSDKPKYKFKAVFTCDCPNPPFRKRTTYFGQAGASDYTIHKDKDRRKRYRDRHKKDLDTGDYTRAGYLSYYILWGNSSNLKQAIRDYKKKFNLI